MRILYERYVFRKGGPYTVDFTDDHVFGILFNPRAWWIGVHHSPANRRVCINLLPCITVYFVKPGGTLP